MVTSRRPTTEIQLDLSVELEQLTELRANLYAETEKRNELEPLQDTQQAPPTRDRDQFPETSQVSSQERLGPRGATGKAISRNILHEHQPSIHLSGEVQPEISRGHRFSKRQEKEQRPQPRILRLLGFIFKDGRMFKYIIDLESYKDDSYKKQLEVVQVEDQTEEKHLYHMYHSNMIEIHQITNSCRFKCSRLSECCDLTPQDKKAKLLPESSNCRLEISFEDYNISHVKFPHHDALVIMLKMKKFVMHTMMIDIGSGIEILFQSTINQMGLADQVIPNDTDISGDSPCFNQVEMNPVWQQKRLIELYTANGTNVTIYSTLGTKGTSWGSNRVMESEVLKGIAEAKGKTHVQVEFFFLLFNHRLNSIVHLRSALFHIVSIKVHNIVE
ncbi:hypothetical protein GIB67_004689 [Kingdonia uniflora]|uniref:Uncharacterized protein n=1 Tax=Kingdonia uniflora TaxID=39325 RepID=A0A7J7P4W9_9MAGN|nr:hypothetical protein GIB67_004689 [Kingdonia uniflora]